MEQSKNGSQLRVGVVGLGAVGSVLSAHLIDAGAFVVPCDIDREKFDAFRKSGIHLEQKIQKEVNVTEACYSIQELGKYDLDLVAVCVKTPSLEAVASLLLKVIPEETFVMCAQNGLDNEQIIAKTFGDDRTLRMVINYAGGMSTPNSVIVIFFHPPNYVAALTPQGEAMADRVAGLLSSADLQTKVSENIQKHVWEKVILNSALSPVCAITRLTMKDVMDSPQGIGMVTALIDESIHVAKAAGIDFGETFRDSCLKYLKGGGYHRPSMLVDLEKGLPTEIDYLNGKVVEYGRKHGLPTPVNESITALVHLLEHRSS